MEKEESKKEDTMDKTIDMAKVGLRGVVASWEVINPDGSIADACYKPKDNLILDVGLDMIGGYGSIPLCFAFFAIGTGTSASTIGMTGLETETTYSPVARPAASGYPTYDAITIPAADADPFVVIYQIGIQTAVGKFSGTFTELGFGPTSTKGANLFSRFRIVDEFGAPTSVTVNIDQQLRLKYQLYIRFLPIVPTAYECAITGYDDTFGYTAGWQGIEESDPDRWWRVILSWFGTSSSDPYKNYLKTVSSDTIVFQPLTTLVNDYPGAAPATKTRDAYVPGSYANYININFTTLQAVGNIYGLQSYSFYYYEHAGLVHWLVEFDTPINKPDTHNLSFKLKFSWGRDS